MHEPACNEPYNQLPQGSRSIFLFFVSSSVYGMHEPACNERYNQLPQTIFLFSVAEKHFEQISYFLV
jgi:hypothetical protein